MPVMAAIRASAHVAIIGRGTDTETEGGVAYALRELGAEVRRIGLRDRASALVEGDESNVPRALVVDPGDRLDLAAEVLRGARAVRTLARVGALLLVEMGHAARIDPAWGFDDFLVRPFGADELYARIRNLEWGRSDFTTDERHKVGGIVVDRARRQVSVDGREVALTAKEFSLLACFCERRGVVMSRSHLLGEVWGSSYQGGPRTVDIHVRRLRAKLGPALPLDTLRGWGYRLRTPETD